MANGFMYADPTQQGWLSDQRPWLRLIDGNNGWRVDSSNATSRLYRVHDTGSVDDKTIWELAVPNGDYRLQATWMHNVTQRLRNPLDSLNPAQDAKYKVYDGVPLPGDVNLLGEFVEDQGQFNSCFVDKDFVTFDPLGGACDEEHPELSGQTFSIASGLLWVELSADAHDPVDERARGTGFFNMPFERTADVVAGPLRVVPVAGGPATRIQYEVDASLNNPAFADPTVQVGVVGQKEKDPAWLPLVYGTGSGNFTMWESAKLRPVWQAYFHDWQDFAGNFPAFGDDPSPDPNDDPTIVPEFTHGSYATPFDELDVEPLPAGQTLTVSGGGTFSFGGTVVLASVTGTGDVSITAGEVGTGETPSIFVETRRKFVRADSGSFVADGFLPSRLPRRPQPRAPRCT